MVKLLPRLLLGTAALILAAGGLMHAAAFGRTLSAVAASDLAPFYADSLKALWLIDSATLITLSVVFAVIAARPSSIATRTVVMLLAVIPAATAFYLYKYIGVFPAANMLIGAAAAAVLGGLGLPSSLQRDSVANGSLRKSDA